MPVSHTRCILVVVCLLAAASVFAHAGSDTPPPGPAWVDDLVEAQEAALKSGKPILCYFTKTYCPHCVKVEQELLSNKGLSEVYDEVVWLYDYQDFSGDERDRRAQRTAIRFGVTSWPQLFLVDPTSLQIVRHTGRALDGFLDAVRATSIPQGQTTAALDRLRAAEARAVRLEDRPSRKLAREGIDDEDIVVRTRALEYLAKKSPQEIVARAVTLLGVPNDPFRFEVCAVLKEAADAGAAEALESLVREPRDSLNPNVLRIRAVQALSTCGRLESLDVIAPHATSGAYFNGLTLQAIDAMVVIGKRHPRALKSVRRTLRRGYPIPPSSREDRGYRACVALARRIHDAVDDGSPFPSTYDAKTRLRLMGD